MPILSITKCPNFQRTKKDVFMKVIDDLVSFYHAKECSLSVQSYGALQLSRAGSNPSLCAVIGCCDHVTPSPPSILAPDWLRGAGSQGGGEWRDQSEGDGRVRHTEDSGRLGPRATTTAGIKVFTR